MTHSAPPPLPPYDAANDGWTEVAKVDHYNIYKGKRAKLTGNMYQGSSKRRSRSLLGSRGTRGYDMINYGTEFTFDRCPMPTAEVDPQPLTCRTYKCRPRKYIGYLGQYVTVVHENALGDDFLLTEVRAYGECIPCKFWDSTDMSGKYKIHIDEEEGTYGNDEMFHIEPRRFWVFDRVGSFKIMNSADTLVEDMRTYWLPWRRLLGSRFDHISLLEAAGDVMDLVNIRDTYYKNVTKVRRRRYHHLVGAGGRGWGGGKGGYYYDNGRESTTALHGLARTCRGSCPDGL